MGNKEIAVILLKILKMFVIFPPTKPPPTSRLSVKIICPHGSLLTALDMLLVLGVKLLTLCEAGYGLDPVRGEENFCFLSEFASASAR